jgi:hypothetical protein
VGSDDKLKPIGEKELDELTARAGVTGLSTVDVRRLLANYRRLRKLLLEAEAHLPDNEQTRTSELAKRLRDEAHRK